MVYKSSIKNHPLFAESNEYQEYCDRVQDIIYKSNKKTSAIIIPLPALVMRDEETWDHKQNYIVAYEVANKKFYACTVHVDMTSFQKDYNKKKEAASITFQEKINFK